MTEEQTRPKPNVVILYLERSLTRMIADILSLEGYPVHLARTASEAFYVLNQHSGHSIVLMDNLHNSREGQRFLATIMWETELWARTDVVSMAVWVICKRLRMKYGRAIDAHLPLPFTGEQLLRVLEALSRNGPRSLDASPSAAKPRALVLAFDPSVSGMVSDILQAVGHAVDTVQTSAEAAGILERSAENRVIVMDNPHNNPEAAALISYLRERLEIRARVRLVGLSALGGEHRDAVTSRCDVDAHIEMPFAVDEFVDALQRLWWDLDPNIELEY